MSLINISGDASVARNYVTYEYWNPLTDIVFYVGAGLKRRSKWHLYEARKYANCSDYPGNLHKINTINQILAHGVEPRIEIVYEGQERKPAFDLERMLIAKYERRDLGAGTLTNLTDGGDEGNWGLKMSEATKQTMSDNRQKEKNAFFGRHHTDENKTVRSEDMKARYIGDGNPFFGKSHTKSTKNQMSTVRKTKMASGDILPTKHSEDHKQWLREKYTGKNNLMAKDYLVVSPSGDETVIRCLKEWCREKGFSYNTLSRTSQKGIAPVSGSAKGWKVIPL